MSVLEKIHGHSELSALNAYERGQLCEEIRTFLVSGISQTGGHLASNLGVVELTVAIETVYNTAIDRLVFDVGHQSYVHKLLTGRQEDFSTLRQFGGIAGFPKPAESKTDAFTAGHASSSVSIALGMARARTLLNEKYHVITLLGDGAATGGMIYEGLNDAAVSNEPMVVVLNDNAMSIDNNVGGMASHLRMLRTKEKYLGMKQRYKSMLEKIPGGNGILTITRNMKDWVRRMLIPTTIFESMGFTYLGPVDGHDTEKLIHLLRVAKSLRRPVLLHVMTQKGRGYEPAEEHPKRFHGIGQFDPSTGEATTSLSADTFSGVFGATMCTLAEENSRICAITAAMPGGTGLLDFKKAHPNRMFDVGIAEEHAVSMAGGLAKQGMIPVVAVYSTFLQRAYDMIMQDICLQKLHVVFAVDRAGLVGDDGETHHGVFDVGFLRQVPGMTVLSPGSTAELKSMMRWAVLHCDGPVAVRYPRGGDGEYCGDMWQLDRSVAVHTEGKDVVLVTYGTLVNQLLEASQMLLQKGIAATVVRITRIEPMPFDELRKAFAGIENVVVVEEVCRNSGIYDCIASQFPDHHMSRIDLGKRFTTHGSVDVLYRENGLDSSSIVTHVMEALRYEN